MFKKDYIFEYLNIINEFNTNNKKWISYVIYKNTKLYLNRRHIIDRKSFRYDTQEELSIVYIKRSVMRLIKHNNLSLLLNNKIKQGIFLIIKNKNAIIHPIIYLGCELQYNFKNKLFQFAICTPLPYNKDENGNIQEPYHSTSDIICTVEY